MRHTRRPESYSRPGFFRNHAWWLIPVIVIDLVLAGWWGYSRIQKNRRAADAAASKAEAPVPPPRKIDPIHIGYPTDQQNLSADHSAAFMPTASGRPESALYGSVRTAKSGSRYLSQFHEGIDIAPVARDAAGRPVDSVYAVADGRVAYLNAVSGNSSYGQYAVVMHPDPLGEIYTLYAHLAKIAPGLKVGDAVRRGALLGLMGNSPSGNIPLARAHLHFEIGLLNQSRFDRWFRARRLKPDHGLYNGQNLTGLNPLDLFEERDADGRIDVGEYIRDLPVAFELWIKSAKPLDYFVRYPGLWSGPPYEGKGMRLRVSEGGVIIGGGNLDAEQREKMGARWSQVARVDESALNRNGRHLIVRRGTAWELGSNGRQWLEILTY